MIAVVAYNADNFSALLPTTRKSTLISVHVCFSALLPTTPINDWCYCLHSGKIIGVVDNNAEKCFEFEYLHEFETICEFTLEFQSGA
jgi:hypothetical protein